MHPEPNIVLVGFTGAGKTTVGAALAARLGRPHVDVDPVVEAIATRLRPARRGPVLGAT